MPTPIPVPSTDIAATPAALTETVEFDAAPDVDSYEVEEIPLERRLNPDGSYVELIDGKPVVIERRQRSE